MRFVRTTQCGRKVSRIGKNKRKRSEVDRFVKYMQRGGISLPMLNQDMSKTLTEEDREIVNAIIGLVVETTACSVSPEFAALSKSIHGIGGRV